MEDATYRRIDIVFKLVAALAVCLGGGLGLWQYFDSAEKQFRKPYWEQQISLYLEATNAAATIATEPAGADARLAAESTFWRLYYGPLALVEDLEVERAMVRFGNGVSGKSPPGELQQLSLRLAHACRESLGNAWSLRLPDLEGRYNED